MIIVLLLAILALLHPMVKPQATLAASHSQYLVVTTPNAASLVIQQELEKRVAEGRELQAAGYSEETHGVSGFILIFRKEVR